MLEDMEAYLISSMSVTNQCSVKKVPNNLKTSAGVGNEKSGLTK